MPSYQFPLDSDPVYSTRIRFTTHNVEPINPGKFSGLAAGFNDMLKDNVGNFFNQQGEVGGALRDWWNSSEDQQLKQGQKDLIEKRNKETDQATTSTLGDFFASMKGYGTKIDENAPVVQMYIPLSMTFNDNIIYDNANLGATGAFIGAAAEAGSGIFSSIAQGVTSGVTNMADILLRGMGEQADGLGARFALQRAVQTAASVPGVPQGLGTTATLALQTSVNPNTRALFRGVALREFTFQFNMVAVTEQESEAIEDIVTHFRTRMYPTVDDPVTNFDIPLAYEFPDVFAIEFKIGNTDIKVPKIDKCYLRNCQVVYNPTGATFHSNGYANEVAMTLTFMEYKTLAQQDIKKGY
tara:strand:+ start:53 stop:1114 length:1062 start_codon:yes stop_codon:yes gene_type:complete